LDKTKIVVIGLDGATLDLIKPWLEKSKLPNLARLARNGVYGNLITEFPPTTPVAWASFITGKNPGKHGIFDFGVRIKKDYKWVIANRNLIHGNSLWKILSLNGKKVGIIGVPMTYPPEKVNGFIIPGFLTPSHKILTYPSDLVEDLEKHIDNFSSMFEYPKYIEGAEDSFLRKWYHIMEIKAQTTFYLLDNYDCDFFMTYFLIIDQIQHFFWKYIDPQHPAFDLKKAEKYGNEVFKVYQRVDKLIGEILTKINGENVITIVMSDHGFGPVYKDVFINWYLEKLGFLKLKSDYDRKGNLINRCLLKVGLTQEKFVNFLKKSGLSKLVEIMPYNIAVKFYWGLPCSRPSLHDIDYSRTKAFSAGYCGQIFINFSQNESYKLLHSKETYEKFRVYLIDTLYKLKDPETNERIVDKVFKREELYRGSQVKYAADLLFTMKNMTYITRGTFEFSTDKALVGKPSNMESGWHRMNGILFIKGDYIKKGKTIENAKIVDIAPTILHIMGIPIPSDMDGKVLKDIFHPASELAKKEVSYQASYEEEETKYPFSFEEEKAIIKKLKNLGYIG
jgi:predicted AlkP superfamily phosphohydrolase/phosphomutase